MYNFRKLGGKNETIKPTKPKLNKLFVLKNNLNKYAKCQWLFKSRSVLR